MKNLRRRIYEIIRTDSGRTVLDYVFHTTITALILLSVVIVFASTFDLSPAVNALFARIEQVVSVVFTVEYLLRVLTADFLYPKRGAVAARVKFVLSPMAVIDLVAILPFWLPMIFPCSMLALRIFRLARILRIVKLERYFEGLRTVGGVLKEKRFELLGSFFFLFVMMMISSLLMYTLEHDAQPEVFRNAFSGFWWSIATLTTVGYGDIYPVTILGRVLASLIALSGVAALAVPTGIVSAGLTEQLRRKNRQDSDRELERQRRKEDEHDRLLKELGELVKRLTERQNEERGRCGENDD